MEYEKRIFNHKLLLNIYFNHIFSPPFEANLFKHFIGFFVDYTAL
jgi:hypothetical protein